MVYSVDHSELNKLCIFLIYATFDFTVEQSLLLRDLKLHYAYFPLAVIMF